MIALHRAPAAFYDERINVHLVGAGGNGSKMLGVLRNLHFALRAFGHPHGLRVAVFDFDRVSRANLVRQSFMPPDVGQYKAMVLVNRFNLAYGLRWTAHPTRYAIATSSTPKTIRAPHILISCVDSRAARAEIANCMRLATPVYELSLGNDQHTGQLVLGQPLGENGRPVYRTRGGRLPTAGELFPELLDATLDDDDGPSCSAAEALERQDLFVNDALAAAAGNLLWNLFRRGLDHHGVFLNTMTGHARPLQIDRKLWNRLSRSNTKKRRETPPNRQTRDAPQAAPASRRPADPPAALA